ncbi:uncharacterized protein [Musca autumnalis]|uniref:uncharacterized protein n=1 Tax=Musca autumnalis TaxID=221902 RepID=UPI003CE84C63
MGRSVASNTRSKRNRSISFDLNRTQVQSPKKKKTNKKVTNTKMQNSDANNDPSFRDMSQTINNPNPSTSAAAGLIQNNTPPNFQPTNPPEVDQLVRSLVQDSLNHAQANLQSMVQASVSKELEKIHAVINKLNSAVSNLSIGAQNNQQNPIPPTNQIDNTRSRSPSQYRGTIPSIFRSSNITPSMMSNQGIRLERLAINFSGRPGTLSIEDFIYRLEHFQRQYRLEWEDILSEFHVLVSGTAHEWYWLQVRNGNISSWDSLKHSLLERFKIRRTCFEAMRDMLERKQMPGESIDAFFQDINLMRSRLEKSVPEYELIALVKKNLRKNLSSIVYAMNVSSLEQLRVECLEVERTFFRKDSTPILPPNNNNRPMRVSSIEVEEESNFPILEDDEGLGEVSAISTQLACWNCQKLGHGFRDCPSSQRGYFCFKCGKQNTITPKCSNCRAGNGRKNVIAAGNQRSSEQPAVQNPQTDQ